MPDRCVLQQNVRPALTEVVRQTFERKRRKTTSQIRVEDVAINDSTQMMEGWRRAVVTVKNFGPRLET